MLTNSILTLSIEHDGAIHMNTKLGQFLLLPELAIYDFFACISQDSRAEGRGRVARLQRRLIIVEVEKRIMQYQIFVDQGLVRN